MFLPREFCRGEALPVCKRIQSTDEGDGDGHGTGEEQGVEAPVTLPAIHWQTLEQTNKTVCLTAQYYSAQSTKERLSAQEEIKELHKNSQVYLGQQTAYNLCPYF